MNKAVLFFCVILLSGKVFSQTSIYDYQVTSLFDSTIHLSSYQGKKILVVNTASTGDRAHQFDSLQILYSRLKDSGLVLLVIPSNDFNNEPKTNAELKILYSNAQFLIATKTSVKGESIEPLYQWLTQRIRNGVADMNVMGDYQKFVVSKDGKLSGEFSGRLNPLNIPISALIH